LRSPGAPAFGDEQGRAGTGRRPPPARTRPFRHRGSRERQAIRAALQVQERLHFSTGSGPTGTPSGSVELPHDRRHSGPLNTSGGSRRWTRPKSWPGTSCPHLRTTRWSWRRRRGICRTSRGRPKSATPEESYARDAASPSDHAKPGAPWGRLGPLRSGRADGTRRQRAAWKFAGIWRRLPLVGKR
jgi:hypothetical protein